MHKLAGIVLRPAGLLYGGIMSMRNHLFDRGVLKSWNSPIPVISVGNITTGGTGKTPIVDWIVKYYHAAGCRTAIISRGYKRLTKGVQMVSDGRTMLLGSLESGDETAMLAANNPETIVIVAEKRREGVEFLLAHFPPERRPHVLVLDDAFQHRQIRRDLDIVVINAREPFSDAHMLPEGRLREPLKGIERADLAIINKIADEREADSIAGELTKKDIPFVKAGISKGRLVSFSESETEPSSSTLPPRAIAFAGIGSPESFAESIRELGIEVVATRFFRDHEHYDKEKLMSLADDAARNNCCLITTEKDYFRLLGTTEHRELLCGVASYYLKIEPEIHEGEDILKNMLMRVVTKGERTCGRNFA